MKTKKQLHDIYCQHHLGVESAHQSTRLGFLLDGSGSSELSLVAFGPRFGGPMRAAGQGFRHRLRTWRNAPFSPRTLTSPPRPFEHLKVKLRGLMWTPSCNKPIRRQTVLLLFLLRFSFFIYDLSTLLQVDVPVTQADFFEAIHNVNRSVGTSDASRIHRVRGTRTLGP